MQENRIPASGAGAIGTRWTDAGWTVALAAVAAWTFRSLLLWDPRLEVRGGGEGVEGWFYATLGSAPGLILVLTAWLAWNRRDRWLAPQSGVSVRERMWALVFGIPSVALAAWGHYVGAPELLVPALSFALLAVGAGWNGRVGLGALWPVAAFALLAHPLPAAAVNWILYPLQDLTAAWASASLDLLGIAHFRSGDRIETSLSHFQVIETCAGLRSIEILVMGAALYVELFYRSRRQALLLLGLSAPLGLVLNHLRVMAIMLIPYSEVATFHTLQGMVVLFLGVFAIAGIDWIDARLRGERVARTRRPVRQPLERIEVRRIAVLMSALALLSALSAILPSWSPPPRPEPDPSVLAARLGEWTASPLKLDTVYLGSVRPSRWMNRRYVPDAGDADREAVEVMLLENDRLNRFHDLLSRKTEVIGTGWGVVERRPLPIGPAGTPGEELVERSSHESRLVLHWRVGFAPTWQEIVRSALVLDLGPWRRPGRALVVRLSTPFDGTPEDEERARERLGDLARLVREDLRARGLSI